VSPTRNVTEQHIDVRGTSVRALSAGSGPPLLYLHGSGDPGTWLPLHEELSEHFTVLRPDHPGFGESDDDDGIDSVHDLSFFYLDLLDGVGISSARVVGVSLGGWLAADLASTAPDRVERLVLVGADGIRVEGVEVPDYFTLDPVAVATHTFHSPELQAQATLAAEEMNEDPNGLRRYLRQRATTAHLGWNPLLHDPKLPNRLHRISCPTLLVWGEHDRFSPVAIGQRYQQLIPHAQLEVVKDAGHLPHAERFDEFMTVVSPFLS
jgi:pimeloyl-ACP methyl ester carboxylesterase